MKYLIADVSWPFALELWQRRFGAAEGDDLSLSLSLSLSVSLSLSPSPYLFLYYTLARAHTYFVLSTSIISHDILPDSKINILSKT